MFKFSSFRRAFQKITHTLKSTTYKLRPMTSHSRSRRPLFISLAILALLVPAIFIYMQFARTTKAAWYNASWSYRKELVFNNALSGTNLTDFPVMVKLTSSNFNFSQAQSAGQDIRFTDTDGTTLLAYEIEKFDTSGNEAIIWVKVPQIDATSTTDSIYVYWGNGSATDAQDTDNTWNANYKGVYHLNDNAANTTVTDSSGLGNNITANENTDATSYVASGQNAGAFLTAGNPINIEHYSSVLTEHTPDLVLDANNHPVIAFYDVNTANLNITHCNDRNCKGGDESVTSPATATSVGLYASIKLDSSGYPVISHQDVSSGDLILTHCNDVNCSGVETNTIVDNSATAVGLYTSLVLDSSDFPVIAYHDATNTSLKFVHCNDLYCAGGDTTVTLDGSGADNVGGQANAISMVLDGSGFPVIVYYDNTNTDLKFIHCNDANCAGGDDTPVTLVTSANDTGRYPDIVLDSSGYPVIVYEDFTGRDTYIIHCNDANCAGETPVLVDNNFADQPRVKLNGSGIPIVVYSASNVYTRVAVCSDAACSTNTQQYLSLYNQYGSYFPSFEIASDGALAVANYNRGKIDGYYDINVITTDHKLDRAYDSDLDFGTGSFSFSAWFKTQGLNKSQQNTILSRYDTDQGFKSYLNYSGQPCIAIDDDATWGPDDSACTIPSNYYPNVDNGNASNPQLLDITLDSNSYPVIAYYDTTSLDLEFIHCNDIYCAGGDETFASLDTAGSTGTYASIVLDSNGYPVISFYTVGSGIKVIHCGDANCSTGNVTNVIDATATTTTRTSLHLDASGFPVVAYYESTGADLRITHCSDANCAAKTTTTVDSTGSVGAYPSMDLDGSGFPVISYQDSTNLDLKLAHCGDANCSAGNTVTTVAATGQNGYYTAMVLDGSGYPVIAYYYNNAFNLQIMHCNDVNCAGANENINTAFQDFDGGNNWMTIKLNNSGYPVVLHTSIGFHTQILTTCNDVNCAGGDESHNYLREEVHSLSHGSLALDSSGFPVIVSRSGNLDVSIIRPGSATYANTNNIDDGAWHHLVGVKNGTSSLTLYIDGTAVATDSSIAATGTLTSNSATLNLAEDIVSGYSINGLDGYLDEVQIDNTARSSDWVKAQFLSESNNFINIKFTQYGAIANTLANFINNTGAVKNNLVAYYKFDEGYGTTTNNSGSIGSAVNATLTNGPQWSNSGKVGKAIVLDGEYTNSDDYISIPDHNSLDVQTGPFTVSAWINRQGATNVGGSVFQPIINKGRNATTYAYQLLLNASDRVTFNLYDGTNNPSLFGTTAITTPGWHHVAGVYDGTDMMVYVDGILEKTDTAGAYSGIATTGTTEIGVWSFQHATRGHFNGLIDEVKIYNAALTAEEIKQDFNKKSSISFGSLSDTSSLTGGSVASNSGTAQYCVPGSSDPCSPPVGEWKFEEASWTNDCTTATAMDTSGDNNHLISCPNTTGPVAGGIGKFGKGPTLDGVDDYFESSSTSLNLSGTITMEAWVKPTATSINDDYFINRTSTNAGYAFGWASAMIPKIRIGNATSYTDVTGVTVLSVGTWYHLTATVDGSGNAKIYVNGKLDTTSTTGILAPVTQAFRIGTRSAGNEIAAGVDEVKLFNYVRTPAQVAWDYNQGKPIAHWKLDECTGTVANDSSGNGNTGTITIGATGTNTTAGTCTTSGAWFDGVLGKFNSSLDFDGTDDYVSVPDANILDMTNQISMSAWVKLSNLTTTNVNNIISKGDTGYQFNVGDTSALKVGLAKQGTAYVIQSTSAIADTNWHFVSVTYDGTTGKAYIDGLDKSSTSSVQTFANTASNLFIGSKNAVASTKYFNGQIDDIRIYNYALTDAQIKNVYNENSAIRFGP